LILVCAFLYWLALITTWKRGAIWRIWHSDRLLDRETQPDRERLSSLGVVQALRFGLCFSLLSAFHFGWRDLNVGNWIARVQPREYVLRSTGWVRVVSGLQSIISVYLLALSVVTYFGRPFE
jgi:nitric oxide reductase large subunit